MPYIPQRERDTLDPLIEQLAAHVSKSDGGPLAFAGRVNYVVSRLALRTLPAKRYWTMALMVGTLVCAILEFYRRFVSPYEDEAAARHGDIYFEQS